VETGSRQENASKQKAGAGSASIRTGLQASETVAPNKKAPDQAGAFS
jgi:hypothetical protein